MSLAADSDEKKLYRRLLTQGFFTIFMASRFGQMANRIQDWWILIPFGNRVYHLPKSKRPRKPETNIQKRFEDMKYEFPSGIFQPGK